MQARRDRSPTATSNFGVGRREAHDASAFYARFASEAPLISDDAHVEPPRKRDALYCGPAQELIPQEIAPGSVALVVTSPPYFAGKEYEEALGEGHTPASYAEYLQMLDDVFAACADALEPGGRIAVNVANLGRRPYRSLSGDVTTILSRLGLLLRGEIIWRKAGGAAGNCAWGSFQKPGNPVLRDLTERIVVASKGRFDRAVPQAERAARNLPSVVSHLTKEDFMESTTDVWEFPSESASRVGHPAPFPVELPARCIRLYTYEHDLVLDPFMGAGSTAVAAVATDRHFVGFDTDQQYLDITAERVAAERERIAASATASDRRVRIPATGEGAPNGDRLAAAVQRGEQAKEIARIVIEDCGFHVVAPKGRRFRCGASVDSVAEDTNGRSWHFLVAGPFTEGRPGVRRGEVLWRALGEAAAIRGELDDDSPLVLLTTDLPPDGSAALQSIQAVRGRVLVDAIELLSPAGRARLAEYAEAESTAPIGALLAPDD